MADTMKPSTPSAVHEAVEWAAAERIPLEVLGAGSKRGVGRPVQAQYTLDLSELTGIGLYEPDELVMSAQAGTPILEISERLAAHDQELAFEPVDFSGFYGRENGAGTIGGAWAANLSGPRRISAGAARDHILGIKAVSGRGESFKSGGRVVKNVTGYDLSRGLAGSWGTLAVLTEITFKVLPKAERVETVIVRGLDDRAAIDLLCRAMGSECEVSGAAHLPADCTNWINDAGAGADGTPTTALRMEGFSESVAYRAERLENLIEGDPRIERLGHEGSIQLWRGIRDVRPFHDGTHAVWKVSVPPTQGPRFVDMLRESVGIGVRAYYDWSGGLVWVEVADSVDFDDALCGLIRTHIGKTGGHATLVRGLPGLRAAISPFQPQSSDLAALSERLKQNFDPHNILNPGRMVGAH